MVLCAFGVETTHHVVQLRGGQEAIVLDLGTGSLEAVLQASQQAGPGGTGVPGDDDARGAVQVDVAGGGQMAVEASDMVGVGLVGHFGAEHLPLFLQHVAEGLDELDAVVLGRVVRSGDHDADPFALERARAEGGDEADAGEDRVEDVAAVVSVGTASGGDEEVTGGGILTPWSGTASTR